MRADRGSGEKRKPTLERRLRSERLAAAAAIFRMSGLLFDFMMSARESCGRANGYRTQQRRRVWLRA